MHVGICFADGSSLVCICYSRCYSSMIELMVSVMVKNWQAEKRV